MTPAKKAVTARDFGTGPKIAAGFEKSKMVHEYRVCAMHIACPSSQHLSQIRSCVDMGASRANLPDKCNLFDVFSF